MNVGTRGTNNVLTKGNTNLITVNRIGNGLKTDGVDDFISTPYSPLFDFEYTDSFSFSIWFRAANNPNPVFNGLIDKSSGGSIIGGYGFGYYPNGRIELSLTYNSFNGFYYRWSDVGQINSNVLYHLVGTWSNQVGNIYLNNQNLTTTPLGTLKLISIKGTETLLHFGNKNNINYFSNSTIYDSKIFNKALSAIEVAQLYNSWGNNISGLEANLVANYNFNQKSGTQLLDSSPNQLHGTLTNFGTTSNLGGGAWVNSLGNTITY